MKQLYPWQKECLNIWIKNEYHGIVNAVTGSGKTRMALAAVHHLNTLASSKLRVKIVVPGKSLLIQWKHTLQKSLPLNEKTELGIYGSGYSSSIEKKYMIYVINSARYRLAREILHELEKGFTVLLIADECHNYISAENRKIFEFLPYISKLSGTYCSLGLSATAAKPGFEAVLVPALGKEIYRYTLMEALEKGTVSNFVVWQISVSFQPDERQEYDQLSEALRNTHSKLLQLSPSLRYCDGSSFFAHLSELSGQNAGQVSRLARTYLQLSYKRKRTVHMAKARMSCVYRLLKESGLKKQILIFGESISQIEQLYLKLMHIYPSKVGRYHSKMGVLANQNTLERFRSGELRILLTCRALDEGIDVPEASVGIILSGTSMERQRLQRLGRILRKHDGKRMACLYYLFIADSQEEHSYFPQKAEYFQVENLSYDEKNQTFYFPAYEQAAQKVLSDFSAQGLSEAFSEEIQLCLRHGYLREDWLLPPKECRQNALQATNTREQNYWICMEQMSRCNLRK